MSDTNLYNISLPEHRRRTSLILNENIRAYDSLADKTTVYAQQMKALQELHRAANNVYKNAESKFEPATPSIET